MNKSPHASASATAAPFGSTRPWSLILSPIVLAVALATPVAAVPDCIDDYAIIQLGDDSSEQRNEGVLEITSNSSVFGSVLKGVDTSGERLKLSTSKITDRWDGEIGVGRESSSSYAGSRGQLARSAFSELAARALEISAYWAGIGGTPTDFSALDGRGGMHLVGTGGLSVFDSTTPFKLTSQTALVLTGGPGDYFVFNIFPHQEFQVSGSAKIVLDGITPGQVLFNVLGGRDKADAQIGGSDVLFAGTLLAPGRHVLVSQTHFHTFRSSGFRENEGGSGSGAPATEPVTYAQELAIFRTYGYAGTESRYGAFTTSGAGVFGQIIAGGKVTWSESDIVFEPFCYTPPPGPDAGSGSRVINLSVRAFVGTGTGVMIPGIVISGEQPARMLIRAVGPTLQTAFGIDGALADPRITVMRDGQPVASNDNWGDAANLEALVQATRDVGAFGFEAGSKDAAMLVELGSGIYTVVIEGVDQATGICLVEVYWLE